MPDIVIRALAPTDTAALARLRREWTEENAGTAIDDPEYDERFADWMARTAGDRVAWVATVAGADGEVVGMLNMAIFERMPRPGVGTSRWGYLANAYVRPEFRNAGVGKLLVDELVAYAQREGLARVVLHPSARAVPFYERAGFGPADMLMAQTF
ncbi:MAG: GNAT family N-acetyltransferase [Hamadaea sp.]|nr:GNAT family N-acetyltransferase [Hamadaea sp.]